jgi:hypothetical protein
MYIPFLVKNSRHEIISCGLTIKDQPDAQAWSEILAALTHVAHEQLGSAEDLNNV